MFLQRLFCVAGVIAMLGLAGCTGSQRAGVGECPTSPEGVRPLLVGSAIPSHALVTPEGKQVRLREVLAAKPTVLVVYRGDWCVYCQKQLADLQKVEPQLVQLGYQIVAISPDTPERLKKSIAGKNLKYQLLSDRAMTTVKDLGLVYTADAGMQKNLDRFGVEPVDLYGQPQYLLAVPAVFLVGTDGRVRFEYVNPDPQERIDPEVLLSAAKCLAGAK